MKNTSLHMYSTLSCSFTNGLQTLNQPWSQRLVILIINSLCQRCRLREFCTLHLIHSPNVDRREISTLCEHFNRAHTNMWWYSPAGELFIYRNGAAISYGYYYLFYSCNLLFGLSALVQVDNTLDLFNDLQLQHQAVATKTKTLHDACDRLVQFYCFSP